LGGTDGRAVVKVTLADVTTSASDYLFAPGSLDPSFDAGPADQGAAGARSVAVQPDGKIILGGTYFGFHGVDRYGITRLNPDGSLDPTYESECNGYVEAIALQSDGKIIYGGGFNNFNGSVRKGIARAHPDGSLDESFYHDPAFDGAVKRIVVQPDGKILICGQFTSFQGVPRLTIARLLPGGTLDASFDPGTGAAFGTVWTMALDPNGRIIIGGEFETFDGYPRNRIARLNSNGSLDTSFNPDAGPNATVNTILPQTDGRIVITGSFTTYAGSARQHVARVNSNGSLDSSFNPGTGLTDNGTAGGIVYAASMQPDGKIIVAGSFQFYNGTARRNLACINANGSLDTSFDPGTGTGGSVFGGRIQSVALQGNGKIMIGGIFDTYNGAARVVVARVNGEFFATWPDGDGANKTVDIPIVDDLLNEPDETLTLALTPMTASTTLGLFPVTTLAIIDNDINTAPVASSQSVSTAEGVARAITLTGSDAEGNPLAFSVTVNPAHGLLSGLAPNLTYTPNPNYSGADSLAFKVNDGLVESTINGTVSITVTTTLANWQQQHFTVPELGNPAASGENADLDGDGIVNLLEYAFNLDPKVPSAGSPTTTSSDATYFSIIYPKRIAATDLIFTVEKSPDAIAWSLAAPTNVILADDGVTQTIKAQVPRMGATTMFLRVRVTH